MTDPEGMKRQSIYMPEDMHQQVQWLAEALDMSANKLYVVMIREGIARRLSKPKQTSPSSRWRND